MMVGKIQPVLNKVFKYCVNLFLFFYVQLCLWISPSFYNLLLSGTLSFLQPAELQWMYICQKCLVGCIFYWQQNGICCHKYIQHCHFYIHFFLSTGKNTSIYARITYICQSVDVKMPVLDVFMAEILYMTVSLTNIHPYVYLSVVKMPCTQSSQ